MLQAGRLQIPVLMRSLNFYLIVSAALGPTRLTQPLSEMSTRGKGEEFCFWGVERGQ
jgi:hypothetical protein